MGQITFITEIQNESADASTAELVDITTGYGGSNPDRDELALYLKLFKRDSSLADTEVIVDNTTPLTVSNWAFNLAGDGWYVGLVYGFPIWAAGSFLSGNCVYYNNNYYKANTNTSGTPGISPNWDLITDIQSEVGAYATSLVSQTQTNNFTTAIAESGPIGDDIQALGQKIVNGKCRDWNDAASVIYGAALLESAWVNFRRADYAIAQEIVDYINSQFANAA